MHISAGIVLFNPDIKRLSENISAVLPQVETLAQHASDRVGMIAPMILDRNKHDIKNVKKYLNSKVFKVKSGTHGDVITSGTLVNLKACAFIGGFDDSFFIDYVDYDFNKRLLLEGYDIIRTDETALIHECGKAEKTADNP